MYIKVIKKNVIRKEHPAVYREQKYEVWKDGYISWYESDPIPRENKNKYDFIACKSYRENGKVKTDQQHIATIKYWDIAGGWGDEFLRDRLIDLYGDNEEMFNYIWNLVEVKYRPIEEEILLEYKQSEEYKYKVYWENEVKRVNDEIKKQREREEEAKRQQYYDFFRDYSSYYSNSFSSSSSIGVSINNKELAKELIKSGFRQLALKCHPDKGGTTQQFQELNILKEQLEKLMG